MLSFFSWWYGRGWQDVIFSIGPRIKGVMEGFSVMQLLRTLFQPWRRIITYPGSSLAEKFKAWGDNLVSRAVGFTVRSGVILSAIFVMAAVILLTMVEIVVWPLLPLAVPGLLIAGVI